MEVREVVWYRKQQKRKEIVRKAEQISVRILLLLICVLSVMSVSAGVKKVRGAIAPTMLPAQELALQKVQEIPVLVEVEKVEAVDQVIASEETPIQILDVERKYLIVLDAGHGGEDEGCSNGAVEEKVLNLTLALKVKEALEEKEFQVLLTRSEDVRLSLEERVLIANEANADAFVSIHQNACADNSASGIETWYYAQREENKRLAQLVQQYTTKNTKTRDRGIMEEDNLYVIRECDMPSCLVETGFLSNAEECTKLQEEWYQDEIAQGIAEAIELYFYPKTMYLTFDDGPVAENTEKVLDILKEKDVKATFFVIGKNAERYPDIIKRIVDEGHTIGIHCYEHDYNVIYASAESYMEDFEKARQTVYEITGEDVKLFRFPGGSINSYNKKVYKEIQEKMTEKGYVYFDWNASLEDAVREPKKEQLLQNAKETTLGRKKVVMLAHDMIDKTVECLEELIEQFPEYRMEALGEEVVPVQF